MEHLDCRRGRRGMVDRRRPLLMTILLLRVSGVTVLERSMGKRRPGYTEYVARTGAFVPMPRRRADR
ncbi:MAG: DUF1295 domain-containing protein [Acidimicrobiaceae bacterium]|nr:DUF1295 domain-containing protein [Acidimicrobiaceae bacterium]